MNLNRSDFKRFLKILVLALLAILYLTLPDVLGTNTKNLLFVLFFVTLFFLPNR